MDYETYDPEKHGATKVRGGGSAKWLAVLRAADVTFPTGIVVRGNSATVVGVVAGVDAEYRGYSYRTSDLVDHAAFVLWAEKLSQ